MNLSIRKITLGHTGEGRPVIWVTLHHPKAENNPTIIFPRSCLDMLEKEQAKEHEEE
jgi:hypothetical protein